MSNFNPTDDELMKAAMGDLDGGTPPRPPQPPKPPTPPTPPQPPLPPNPSAKKKSKVVPIIAAVMSVVVVVIVVIAFTNGQNSGPDYYYDGDGYDEEYVDYEEDLVNNDVLFSFNPFDAIEYAVIDNTTDSSDLYINKKYNKSFGEYTVRAYGSGGVQVVDNSGKEIAVVYFECDLKNYRSTGTVTIGILNAVSKSVNLEKTSLEITPLTSDYLMSFNDVSQADFDTLKNGAINEVKNYYSDFEYVCAYFGSNSVEKINSSVNKSLRYNILSFVFKYTDELGTWYLPCTYSDLKLLSDGRIQDVECAEGTIKDSFSSLSEADDDEFQWENFEKINK